MKILAALALLLACGAYAVRAVNGVVEPGANIEQVEAAMTGAGYRETELAMAPRDDMHRLKMWAAGDGVLICTFAIKDGTVSDIGYFLCDERPKAVRKEFYFSVEKFQPDTGEMNMRISTGTREGKSSTVK